MVVIDDVPPSIFAKKIDGGYESALSLIKSGAERNLGYANLVEKTQLPLSGIELDGKRYPQLFGEFPTSDAGSG